MEFRLQQIIDATGAHLFGDSPADAIVTDFIFDSRSVVFPEGTLFVALRSEAADGHSHITSLISMGVRYFIVDNVPSLAREAKGCCFLLVKDTFQALEQLGAAARNRINGEMVAITGSQGKTVVKEMIHAMAPAGSVWTSPRSWNSRIGVPASLLEADENARACVIEAGIDGPGDMATLERIIRPTVGVFTGLTSEHDSGFSGRRQKLDEKLLLFRNVRTLVYNSGDKEIAGAIKARFADIRLVGVEDCSVAELDKLLASEAIIACGITPSDVKPAMVSNRLDVHQGVNDCTIVYDGFTHDMRSLRASLDFMRRRSSAHLSTTVILGDMVQDDAAKLPALLEAFGVSRVVGIGHQLGKAFVTGHFSFSFEKVDSVAEFLEKYDINQFSSENILIAGGPSDDFLRIKSELESARHDTIFEINLDAIVHNFNEYRSRVNHDTGMIAMVKASAYGLGALEISRALQAQGAAYLAVAVIDEGVELRRGGITMPIVVLNPVTTNYRALFKNRLEPSVFSIGELNTLVKEARKAGVKEFNAHIKLDTGMHRVGFTEAEIPALADALAANPELHVSSIFSHLATADCPDQSGYTSYQLANFERMSSRIMDALPYPVKRHILNTAGIATHPEYQHDMVRLGIGLYGVNPLPSVPMNLRPVATLKTTVISLKHWKAGTTIGYGRRGVLNRDSVIATIPIGYADGLDRHLSCGATSMIVRGVECPTVGNICMDQCMIDVTDVMDVALGDDVEVFGNVKPVEQLADILSTIPYEILTSVSPRVKRVYYRD